MSACPPGTGPVTSLSAAPPSCSPMVSVGGTSSCRISADCKLHCWGPDEGARVPQQQRFSSVSVADTHACAVGWDRQVVCWGPGAARSVARDRPRLEELDACDMPDPEHGPECTPPAYEQTPVRIVERPVARYLAVVATSAFDCGLDDAKDVRCWGEERMGWLESPPGPFERIALGGGFGCGLRANGRLVCWGANAEQLHLDADLRGSWKEISAGGNALCALSSDAALRCWGGAYSAGLAQPDGRFRSVAVGSYFACGVLDTGWLKCWPFDVKDLVPRDVPSGAFQTVGVGIDQACAMRADGEVLCFGMPAARVRED